jgi:ribosomal-protein-serine acetyltransferase
LAVANGASLRLPSAADATELHELIEANRDYLARWLPWAASQTFEDTLDFIRKAHSQMTANDGFQMAMTLDSRIIGMAGFPEVDWANRCTRVGYWLAEPCQGRGIATTAAEALVEHAFSVWDLNRVEIQVAEENRRSRAVAERLGFRQEGTLRQAEHVKSGYLDRMIYAMLREDWRAQNHLS